MPLPRISNKLASIAKSTITPGASKSFYEVSEISQNKKRSSSKIKEEPNDSTSVEEEIETKPIARKRVKKEEHSAPVKSEKTEKTLSETIDALESEEGDNFPAVPVSMNTIASTARQWVVKSEPHVYGVPHIEMEREGVWDGVHNYQARNFMKLFRRGDLLYFYHSNTAVPGIYGLMEVTDEHSPDPTALDPKHRNFDKRIKQPELNPWVKVGTRFLRKYAEPLTLTSLKQLRALQSNALVKKGNRLSVMPLTPEQHEAIHEALAKLNPV